MEDKFPDFMVLTTNRSILDGDIELSGIKLATVNGVYISIGSMLIKIPYSYSASTEIFTIRLEDISSALTGRKLGIFFFILTDEKGWLPVGPFLGEKYHGDSGPTKGS